MKVNKKKKDNFKEFRNNDIHKTFKRPLKTIQLNSDTTHPVVNDLIIHTYQFIRLYVLNCYMNKQPLPDLDEIFISYCIKSLIPMDNRGKKRKNISNVEKFYQEEYQPLLNHEKTNLKNKSFLIPFLATQINTSFNNNFQERFIQHFLQFINITTTEITEEKETLFQFKKHLFALTETDEMFNEWKNKHLLNILPTEIKKSIHYDVKVRPFEYIKGILYMNEVLEKMESELFQPLHPLELVYEILFM